MDKYLAVKSLPNRQTLGVVLVTRTADKVSTA
jgi:hypothetical protein